MNDILREAGELLIALCGKQEHIEGMEAMLDMLCAVDEDEFYQMSDNDKAEWAGDYLPE